MEKKINTQLIHAFHNAMWEVESLKEFYSRSEKSLIEYRLKVEGKYEPGKIVGDIFDSILRLKNIEEKNSKLAEVIDTEIDENILISDVFKIEPFSEEKQAITYSIKEKYRKCENFFPDVSIRKYKNIQKFENILIESTLSHTTVIYESFLEKIYEMLLWVDPLKYFEGQTIYLADVFTDDFQEKVSEKFEAEIESKMFDALKTTEIICQKEEIDINRYGEIISEYSEISFRRNAYVHTNGRVNKKYLKGVSEKYSKGMKVDDKLLCDYAYIENAFQVLTKMIFSLTFELLRKNNADKEQINSIANYFFEKLKEKEYSICKYVYYGLSQYKALEFVDRTMYRVNYINAIKQLGETKLVDKELKGLDVSIATDDYKIAKECLTGNNEIVYQMLCKTYPDSFGATEIREWPIFINFRETEFYSKFVSDHVEDFDLQEIELPENEKISVENSNNDEDNAII